MSALRVELEESLREALLQDVKDVENYVFESELYKAWEGLTTKLEENSRILETKLENNSKILRGDLEENSRILETKLVENSRI